MSKLGLMDLEGGATLCDWFGGEPSFHDSDLCTLELRHGGDSILAARIHRLGPEVDSEGYYVVTRRALVTFTLRGLVEVELHEFMEAACLDGMEFESDDAGVTLRFDASYGVYGHIKAKEVTVGFTPALTSS